MDTAMPLLEPLRLRMLASFIGWADRHRPPETTHLATGRRGELAAFFYLRQQGYVVISRGWKSSRLRGDIDLIGFDGDTICFIEVKTRTTRDVATAEAAVDENKRRILCRLARAYLRQLPNQTMPTRFDILSIYFEKETTFELFRNAFDWL
ncbi:MAG TPA: YraN family protein [Alloacidobacterium sp.]|nr:YraN family protein [Alloacidobacterium sp.]